MNSEEAEVKSMKFSGLQLEGQVLTESRKV